MVKKILGWIVITIFVVAVLTGVYFFLTKGYSGGGLNIAPILPTQNTNPSSNPSQETGSITSSKITLTVTSPESGSTLGSTNVVVKGRTSPGAEVFVNDQSGKADAYGNFAISIGLDEGENQIVVLVNDLDGNAAQEELTVTVASFE